jgi:hypothetical protein
MVKMKKMLTTMGRSTSRMMDEIQIKGEHQTGGVLAGSRHPNRCYRSGVPRAQTF